MPALPTVVIRHRGASLTVRQSALAGSMLEEQLAPPQSARRVIELSDESCGSVSELKAFLTVAEHRWGVLRTPLTRPELLRVGQCAVPLMLSFKATATLQGLRECARELHAAYVTTRPRRLTPHPGVHPSPTAALC